MRLKKWRNPRTNAIVIFVNNYLDLDDVTVTDDGQDSWRVGVPPRCRAMTSEQVQEIKEGIEDVTGVTPEDGFKALCKAVDW